MATSAVISTYHHAWRWVDCILPGCGDYSTTPGLPAQNACDTRCTGNGREVCGGTNLMLIYGTPVTALQSYFTFFGTWTLQGCFV